MLNDAVLHSINAIFNWTSPASMVEFIKYTVMHGNDEM